MTDETAKNLIAQILNAKNKIGDKPEDRENNIQDARSAIQKAASKL
jgi:hypothetical protein